MATQPPRPTSGASIIEWCQRLWDYLVSLRPVAGPGIVLRSSANGTIISAVPTRRVFPIIPPFHCTLRKDGETYLVTVHPGRVTDHIPGEEDTDALATFEPGNLRYSAEDADPAHPAGSLREFPITVGDSVAVSVDVLPSGAIGHDQKPKGKWVWIIVARGDGLLSSHYIPPVAEDEEGSPGGYIYQLAVLEPGTTSQDPPKLKPILAGSHLDHFRERWMGDNAGSGAQVLKEYLAEEDSYFFRTLTEPGEVSVTQDGDEIEIRGNSIDGSLTVTPDGGSPETLVEWVDGLVTTPDAVNIDLPAPFPGGINANVRVTKYWIDTDGVDGNVPMGWMVFRDGLLTDWQQPVDGVLGDPPAVPQGNPAAVTIDVADIVSGQYPGS